MWTFVLCWLVIGLIGSMCYIWAAGKLSVTELLTLPIVLLFWPVLMIGETVDWLMRNENLIIWERKHRAHKVTLIRKGGRRSNHDK